MPIPTQSRPLVVLIDDDPAVRDCRTVALGLEGFDVLAYESGEELLGEPAPDRACCLVVDLNLPGVNGLTLIARLRSAGVRVPAILVTTNPSALVRARAMVHGAIVVEKPLLTDSLLDALRRAIKAA